MAVPKRRTSKSKRNMRRSHHAISIPNLIRVDGKLKHRHTYSLKQISLKLAGFRYKED